jgi:hypothetical protein
MGGMKDPIYSILILKENIIPNSDFWVCLSCLSSLTRLSEASGRSYITQTGLELTFLLLQPPGCWDYRNEPPHTPGLRQIL